MMNLSESQRFAHLVKGNMSDRLLNPQQELFLERYTNPKSPTFGNAKQSALEANYSEEYSDNIMSLMPDWLSENIGDMRRLKRAEKNLTEVQNIEIINEEGKADPQLIEKRTKVDIFLAERLNKAKYSPRLDVTSGGEKLKTEIHVIQDKAQQIFDENQ